MSTAVSAQRRAPPLAWRPTKIMHIQDLPKDDDFLSHLLIEKLGTGAVPLLVHKMDPSRRLPKTHTQDLMAIVRRFVTNKMPLEKAIKQAVDELLTLPSIRYFLKLYTQKQINAFATHASRYFELYNPSGIIEIAHTSRYSHRTGKSELCILATRNIPASAVITELKGSMANLTDEEDKELKRTDLRNCDIRRDFSVIHSRSMKKNHLFLGPARFVNHDCNNNCELFREGRYITFRTLRPIAIGEELTAHYGDGYFGKKNKHCLCESCEKAGRGGYAPHRDEDSDSDSSEDDSDSDSDESSSSSSSESDEEQPALNLNERRTRRGVYAVAKQDDSSDESDEEDDDDSKPLANAADVPADGEIELTAEFDTGSDLTSLAPSGPSSGPSPARLSSTPALMTPNRAPSSLTELTPSERLSTSTSTHSTPFRSIIATRGQKVRDSVSARGKSSTPMKPATRSTSTDSPQRLTRSVSSLRLSETAKGKANGTATPPSNKSAKPSAKEDAKAKEETEARVLRARPGAIVAEAVKEAPKKPEAPRGPDGKLLPTCMTCSNVLPVISVASRVVYGLEMVGKKNKHVKLDCPRCIRHFAIYQVAWPRRVALPGMLSATPREDSAPVDINTKNVTRENLPVIDREIAAVASSSSSKSKKRRQEVAPDPQPKVKRRRSEPEPVLQRPKVTKTYSSVTGRRRMIPRARDDCGSMTPLLRPTTKPPPPTKKASAPKVKVEDAPDAEKVLLDQPRAVNGRFAKKSKSSPSQSKGDGSANSSPRKRTNEDMDEPEESPRKRSAGDGSPDHSPFSQKVIPRRSSGFRTGGLFSKPTPLSFAIHAWSHPVVLDDSSTSSEDDSSHPVTPEDSLSPGADIVEVDDNLDDILRAPITIRSLMQYVKPSPLAFARSRWTSFGQAAAAKRREQTRAVEDLDKLYASEGETSESPGQDIMHSPSRDVTPSDDGTPPARLKQSYPVFSPTAASKPCVLKNTRFLSANSETIPTFINAGWDDASDATEI